MVWLGSENTASAEALWKDLFIALSVNEDDDIFARWLEEETKCWTSKNEWKYIQPSKVELGVLDYKDISEIDFLPARVFVKDLKAIINAKNLVTRRQWTSLLEAILRIGAVAHVIWLCDFQSRTWAILNDALNKKESIKENLKEETKRLELKHKLTLRELNLEFTKKLIEMGVIKVFDQIFGKNYYF
jgi:hypothetical protein